jgi:3-hydroxybutyryl-CoA dehydrogenase
MPTSVLSWNFILQAVNEQQKLKESIFQKLSKIVRANVILATNTSSISITKIAAASQQPKNVRCLESHDLLS